MTVLLRDETASPEAYPVTDSRLATHSRPTLVDALGGRGWAGVLGATTVCGVALRYPPAMALLVGFILLFPLEARWRRHPWGLRRPGLGSDIAHFLWSNTLKAAGLVAAGAISWLVLHPLVVQPDQRALRSLPHWAYLAVAFAAIHITYYWEHRLAHRWRFLWRFHALHHSSERLDWLAATRLHPAEGFIGGFVLVAPLLLLGFSPAGLGVAGAVFALNDVVIHANVKWRLRWLGPFVPTPEYHHWHHADEPQARDKNFGWPALDLLFGTYYLPRDRRPQRYGIGEAVPEGYLAQLAWSFRRHEGRLR